MPDTEREATGVTARLRFYADRRRGRVMLGVLAVLVAIAVAGALAAVLSSSKKTPTGPLTSAEVMGAVRAFASAYSDRDPRALARALAPDVERVSPTAVEHGRAAVLAEYEQQFGTEPIRAYELADAQILAGPVGRVSGSYTVLLRGRAVITGTVAFGVERVGGRAEIGLIATQ
jgi:stage V sporulation protein SpoVS